MSCAVIFVNIYFCIYMYNLDANISACTLCCAEFILANYTVTGTFRRFEKAKQQNCSHGEQ